MQYEPDAYAAANDADALLILTDWREFAELDLARLHRTMRYPIIIDGRNLFDPQTMLDNGFTYLSVGRPAATAVREAVAVQQFSEVET